MIKIIYDASITINPDIAVYKGDPEYKIIEHYSIKKGQGCNVWQLIMGCHTGTHVDAPKHFIDEGTTLDKIPIDCFFGKAKLFEIKGTKSVNAEHLKGFDIKKGDIIILKTDNSEIVNDSFFHTDYAYLSESAALYLAEKEIKTIGFDYLSIEQFGTGNAVVHKTLLGKDIVIIEGLNLKDIPEGEYFLSALPLKLEGGNGCPVRAVLIKESVA